MNAPVAGLLADLPLPRQVAIAHLLRTALHTARELGRLYAAFAGRTEIPPLRTALVDLWRAKATEVSALESLARATAAALREEAGPVPDPAWAGESGNGRPEDFGRVFRGEQVLAAVYREVLTLARDPACLPGLADLATAQGLHRVRVRDLYRQYS